MAIQFGDEHLSLPKKLRGVYKMVIDNKWFYVGSSVDLKRRMSVWKHHISKGHLKNRNIRYLLPTISKVNFEVLELVSEDTDPKDIEGLYLWKHYYNKLCLNISLDAHKIDKKKKHYGYIAPKPKGKPSEKKRVAKFDLSGNLLCIYESINEAARETGVKADTIRKVFNGKAVSPREFVFKAVGSDGRFIEPKRKSVLSVEDVEFIVRNYETIGNAALRTKFGLSERYIRYVALGKVKCGVDTGGYVKAATYNQKKSVIKLNQDGVVLATFKSICAAAKDVGVRPSRIQRALQPKHANQTVFGYKYRYAI